MEHRPAVKRKFAYIGAGWLAGLLLFPDVSGLWAYGITAAGVVLSAAAFAVFGRGKHESVKKSYAAKHFIILFAAAFTAVCFFGIYSQTSYEPVTALDGREVAIEGTVTDCKTLSSGRHQIIVSGRLGGSRTKVLLYLEGFSRGEGIRAEFTAKLPENSYSFEAEDYYRSLGIYLTATGKVNAEHIGGGSGLLRIVDKVRSHTLSRIYEECGGQSGAMIAAMLCADKSRLEQSTNSAVYRAGIGHLFAVSGTHIVILVSFLSLLLGRLPISQRFGGVISIGAILLFAMFAGFTPSVLRASLMMSVSLTAVFFRRHGDSANSLGIAAILITLANPFAVTSLSFQLSFAAAAAFGALAPAITRGRVKNPTLKHMVACICVCVAAMPICAMSFSEISLIAPLSDLLLIPICTLCLYLVFLFTLTGGLLVPAVKLADVLAALTIKLCKAVTAAPFTYAGTYRMELFAAWGLIATAVFVSAALVKKRRPADIAKCMGLYLMICVLAVFVGSKPPSDRLIVFPTTSSRGYSVLLLSDGDSLIYDMGAGGSAAYSAARMTERLHSPNVCVFTASEGEKSEKTLDAYGKDLAEQPRVSAAAAYMPQKLSAYGALIEPSDGGFRVTVSGVEIVLAEDSVTVGDRVYRPEFIEEITEIAI